MKDTTSTTPATVARSNDGPRGRPRSEAQGSLAAALDVIRCVACKGGEFEQLETGLRCRGCSASLPITAQIIDALVQPSPIAVDELRGMMLEAGLPEGDFRKFIVRRVAEVSKFEERKRAAAAGGHDYDSSTEQNFIQALEWMPARRGDRVLEVGGEHDFPFLMPFRDRGCTCFEANLDFTYDDAATRGDWPVRVVADINELPFRDGSFDVTFTSATTHHSATLDRAIGELARVTRAGGVVALLNEPIRGALKHAFARRKVEKGKQDQVNRNPLVHEFEYSILEYMRAFRKSGLKLEASLFADYYARKLDGANVSGVRFGQLARVVSRLWGLPVARRVLTGPGLWIGQATVGLQMNVVLRKKG